MKSNLVIFCSFFTHVLLTCVKGHQRTSRTIETVEYVNLIALTRNYNCKILHMYTVEEKRDITINTLLYILQQLGGVSDFHKVFKILYFADEKHLAKYGSAINPDSYVALTYGPVPSMAYEILKSLRSEGFMANLREEFTPYFRLINKHTLQAITPPDLDYLSDSEKACIDESIKENRHLAFAGRTEKSHDKAYDNADEYGNISLIEMAKLGGANEAMLHYIKESLENSKAVLA